MIYTIFIIIGIVILVNFISANIFFRWDATQEKDYSLSNVSKDTAKNLDDIINIKGFFSKELPANLISIKQDVQDIVEEYKNNAKGKIRVSYVDPKDDQKFKEEAQNLGIPEVQFSTLAKDKYEVSTGYLGLAVIYGDKKEIIPVVDNTDNLEYDLTSAIKKVMMTNNFSVGFIEPGNIEGGDDYRLAKQFLQKLYNVQAVDLANGDPIPDDLNTLIIVGLKDNLSDKEKYVIDQFLMKGKSLLVLQESYGVNQSLQATKNESGLNSLLEYYGIKINNDFVLDSDCEVASFSSGTGFPFITEYPYWVKINKDGFNQDNAIVKQLESAVFPWASSLELVSDKMEGKEGITLISASKDAWLQNNPSNLSPQQDFAPTSQGKKNLSVFLSGKFTSYFKDKEKPSDKELAQKEFVSETPYARIIVVGDSDFITEGFLQRFKPNVLFFQNAVDALTMDESLIQIRSKGVSDRPIKSLSDQEKNSVKFFNIFGITVIVLLAGLVRYFLRKKTKFEDKI